MMATSLANSTSGAAASWTFRALRTRTRLLIAFVVINAVVVGALSAWSGAPWHRHKPHWQSAVLQLSNSADSWHHMQKALEYLRASNARPVYGALLAQNGDGTAGRIKFQYPLSSLLFFAPLQDFSEWLGLANDKTSPGFNRNALMAVVALPFLLATLLASYAVFERVRLRQPGGYLDNWIASAVLITAAAFTFFPIVKAYERGQIQVWLNAFFAVALWAFIADRKRLAGVLVGLMCLVKPQYVLFLAWGALRREWGFAAACLVTGAIGGAASLLAFGWAHNIDYLTALSFLSQHGESFYVNQSVNGILNRIMSLGDRAAYPNIYPVYFPPYNPIVHVGTLLSSALILAAAFAWRTSDRVLDFCIMAISLTVASPIAWDHHYGVLFPIFALMAAQTTERTALIWLGTSYVLCANWLDGFNRLAYTPLNVLQSYLFFGAAILLVLLYRTSAGRFWHLGRNASMGGDGLPAADSRMGVKRGE